SVVPPRRQRRPGDEPHHDRGKRARDDLWPRGGRAADRERRHLSRASARGAAAARGGGVLRHLAGGRRRRRGLHTEEAVMRGRRGGGGGPALVAAVALVG